MWRVAAGRTAKAAPFERFLGRSRGGGGWVGIGGGHKKRAMIYLPCVRETRGALFLKRWVFEAAARSDREL